jgi:hypothetical protein
MSMWVLAVALPLDNPVSPLHLTLVDVDSSVPANSEIRFPSLKNFLTGSTSAS